ncbi:amidase [Bombardia bombarda]|uniref:amidase n=1 Tax=Bombardia bombarda TaxID=252184 RepID=A0AA39WUV5_9PEZI|nr:amidase [Bombardia bombarda]
MGSTNPSTWESISLQKRASLSASIPPEWRIPSHLLPPPSQTDVTIFPKTSGWFTPEELAITSSSAASLLSDLASGKLTSVAVTTAFCKRAAAAHQLTNCLSEIFFDRALATAAKLDDHLARTGKTVGSLHGLPVSLKDNFNLIGVDSTVGFTSHVGDPAKEDALLVEMLRDRLGAVFYVKTNVPTAMMIAETVNNLTGRTVNPKNRRLTSGGSSGGESALIAFGGSVLGVGTDIGGSLRIPAACTGLFTIRPSFGRFPTGCCRSGMPGQEAVHSVNGPLATSLDDLEYYCKSVVDAEPWTTDPKCMPIPWRQPDLPQTASGKTATKLKVGIIWHDNVVLPTPPVTRALQIAKEKLLAAGHEVIDWTKIIGDAHKVGAILLMRMFVADGGKAVAWELERTGEPLRPEMAPFANAEELGSYAMWKLHLERSAFQKRYLDLMRTAGVDVLLGPTMPFAAVENGTFRHVGYTGVFNVLDYSSISFPTGVVVDKDIDRPLKASDGYTPLSSTCAAIHNEYNPEAIHGMPVSLQLTAKRLEEEKAIAMCRIVMHAMA